MMTVHLLKQPTARATDFKKSGWRGVYERLAQSSSGVLTVMNHQRPEAVLLTIAEYERLLDLASIGENKTEDLLSNLRQDFDIRLESLKAGDLGDRARKAMDAPIKLGGEWREGESH
jgi:PHD/YefM family antitoxin component YafN of YafNO toxin-antitoxin module